MREAPRGTIIDNRWTDEWGPVTTSPSRTTRCARGRVRPHRARRGSILRAGAERLRPLSLMFFADVERFESTRPAWRTTVVDRYIERFVELVKGAEEAGEIRPVNFRFLGEVLRQIGLVTRDERVLRASGLTSEEAVLEVGALI
jgi:hypothetical protein